MRTLRWAVRLSTRATADFDEILTWTAEQFGDSQARSYRTTISEALRALVRGPTATGVRLRTEIGPDLYTLHVARGRRRGRHVIVFRLDQGGDQGVIAVARILHDAMDIARHLPPEPGGGSP